MMSEPYILKKMDATTAERINNLAKNLKDLHLASSMEDAFSKAREIILGTQSSGKPISQMESTVEALTDVQEVEVSHSEDIKQAKSIQETVSEVRESQVKDELNNEELSQENSKAAQELKKYQAELEKIKHEIEHAKAALEEAKRVKDSFSRQIPDMTIGPKVAQEMGLPQKPRSTLSEDDKKKSDLSKIFNFGKR